MTQTWNRNEDRGVTQERVAANVALVTENWRRWMADAVALARAMERNEL